MDIRVVNCSRKVYKITWSPVFFETDDEGFRGVSESCYRPQLGAEKIMNPAQYTAVPNAGVVYICGDCGKILHLTLLKLL